MRFGVLGPLAVWTAGGAEFPLHRTDLRTLLAALLVHSGTAVSVNGLIDDLWPANLPADPTNALQIRVSRLRRTLESAETGGRALVELDAAGYRLRVPADAVDAGRFQRLVREAGATADPSARARLLSDALALWRGPALAGFEDEAFAVPVVQRLTEQRLGAVEDLAEARLAAGDHHAAAAELAEWVHRHPERERLLAAQLRALHRSGRRREALAGFAAFRSRLAETHGLDPGPELLAVHQALLAGDPAPARPVSTLPAPVTTLIGRDTAIADVVAALRSARLVTLTGPGGVGKTRLALAAAAEHAGPARLVELAGVTATDDLADAVLAALGVRENSMLGPVPGTAPMSQIDRLVAYLRGRELVIVLDNCEHLVEQVARLARTLLAAAPGLRLLATGREPLGIPGEVLRPVPPLPTPDPGATTAQVRASDAVRLFTARAVAADPAFVVDAATADAVAALVRGLDGLPLALELAAAKVRSLGVHELAARLDDRFRLLAGNRGAPQRQQTLLALLDWSWELLSEPERVVLSRLAVLESGNLAAVESICGADVDDPAGALGRLVDRSMVAVGDDGRYRLAESVRAYAQRHLVAAGDLDATRQRHARHYISVAVSVAADLFGPDQDACLGRLDAEAGNFAAALDHAGPPLVDALAWYLLLRGRVRQLARWAARALDQPGPAAPRVRCWAAGVAILLDAEHEPVAEALASFADDDPAGLAMAQWFLAYVLFHGGELDTSEELVARAAAGYAALDHPWGRAVTASLRAHQALARGRPAAVAAACDEALVLFRALGDRGGELLTSYPRAALAELRGDLDDAERLHRDGLAIASELGMWAEAADRLSGLGRIAMLRDDHNTARELHERARSSAAEHGFRAGEIYAVTGLGLTARRAGRLQDANEHLLEAAAWYRRTGGAPGYATVLVELGHLAECNGGTGITHFEEALAAARRIGDTRSEAAALVGLAGSQLREGRPEAATERLDAAAGLRGDDPVPPADRDDLERITEAVRMPASTTDQV